MNIKKIAVFLCVAMLPVFAHAADTQTTKHHTKKHHAQVAAHHTTDKSKAKSHKQATKSKTSAQAGKKSHKKTKHVA